MTVALVWIVRAIILLLVLRFVFRLMAGGRSQPASRPRELRKGGTLVRDPQCGTYIPQNGALSVVSGAERVYFCSPACRDAWVSAGGAGRSRMGA